MNTKNTESKSLKKPKLTSNLQIDFSSQIALLQLSKLGITNKAKILSYIQTIPKNSIILLGEYVLDLFFTQIKQASKNLVLQNVEDKISFLKELSKEHCIVCPILSNLDSKGLKQNKIYKQVAIAKDNKISFYMQQRLINYSHWDEQSFFDNPLNKSFKTPFIIEAKIPSKIKSQEAKIVRIAILTGFEAHFDELWVKLKHELIDVVLIPTANTFSSSSRWRTLLSAHSFTNSCYVFRANRIGKEINVVDGIEWDFYGDSFVCLDSNVQDCLKSEEGILIYEIDKQLLQGIKNEWGFI